MSDEGFLKRWSRKKRAETASPAAEREAAATPSSQASPAVRAIEKPERRLPQAEEGSSVPAVRGAGGQAGAGTPARGAPATQDDEAIDPATLPPLESLGPDSDYTVFLKKGVPEALRIAALRKAWMSDPFIRDFRGPAEYALDYTTSEFDLRPTDDVAKMLDRIFPPQPAQGATPGEPPATEGGPAERAQPSRVDTAAAPVLAAVDLPQKPAEAPAAPTSPTPSPPTASTRRRKHGGAMPDKAD